MLIPMQVRSAAREYFFMTVSALNMIRLENGEDMCESKVQRLLWEEVSDGEVPYHMWHPWLNARIHAILEEESEEGEE